MRSIVLFIICLFGYSFTFSQSAKTIRTYGITKKTETVIKYHDGEEVARYTEEVEHYNNDGEWIDKFTFSSGGELKMQEKRVYDGDKVVDETTIDVNGSGIKNAKPPGFERAMYTYDKGDVVLEKKISEDGETIEQSEFTYNKLGDLVQVTLMDGAGIVFTIETIEYDGRGLKIKERVVSAKGNILKEKFFKYE